MRRVVGLVCVSLWSTACTAIIPGIGPRDIPRDAADEERKRCDREPVDARLYSPDLVLGVAPHYAHVMGGPNGTEMHLTGAEVELRPLPGVTSELLERGLLCRSARLILGHAQPLPNEPYGQDGRWVKVSVRSGEGSFVVTVTADNDDEGHALYARAQAFAHR